MITSGSHTPGIDLAAWQLPGGTALRYERPTPALRGLIADYAILDSDLTIYNGTNSWILPGSPMIWVGLTAQDLYIKMRVKRPALVGIAMLIGPSSVAMPVESHGGISVVMSPTPRGWSRLFSISAEDVRDQMWPLEHYRPAPWTAELVTRLQRCDRGTEVKGILDDFLTATMPPPTNYETLIGRIERLIAETSSVADVSNWHNAVGLGSARTLARACSRYFGFSPKVLQRRRRFLDAFTAMLIAETPVDHRVAPAGYCDVSHFIRDARDFLGITPKQFLTMPMEYLRAVLRARTSVIGTGMPLLD